MHMAEQADAAAVDLADPQVHQFDGIVGDSPLSAMAAPSPCNTAIAPGTTIAGWPDPRAGGACDGAATWSGVQSPVFWVVLVAPRVLLSHLGVRWGTSHMTAMRTECDAVTDNEWLDERFEDHRGRLRAIAYRMLGSQSEADDAVQEAWVRVHRADTDGRRLGGWLTTVASPRLLEHAARGANPPRGAFESHVPDLS